MGFEIFLKFIWTVHIWAQILTVNGFSEWLPWIAVRRLFTFAIFPWRNENSYLTFNTSNITPTHTYLASYRCFRAGPRMLSFLVFFQIWEAADHFFWFFGFSLIFGSRKFLPAFSWFFIRFFLVPFSFSFFVFWKMFKIIFFQILKIFRFKNYSYLKNVQVLQTSRFENVQIDKNSYLKMSNVQNF